jgi:adenylate cyclase
VAGEDSESAGPGRVSERGSGSVSEAGSGPGSEAGHRYAEDTDHELVTLLRSLGGTDEQIAEARRQCRMASLAGDLVLAQGANLSAVDVAERAGTDVDQVVTLWRTLGVSVPDAERPMFSEQDARLSEHALRFERVGAHGDELFRVLGNALARVAEAAVAYYVQTVQPEGGVPDGEVLDWARAIADATALSLRLGDSMGGIFAHHMRDAIDRQRIAQAEVSERSLFRLGVGFVDLVGFTPLSRHAAPSDLLKIIGRFEARAFEVAVAHNGRIVKHIGDEVMFVALDATDVCAIARSLMQAFQADGISPRGGLAFGDVITRHGDYYGPVVNLASRLADLAIPEELLVDSATAGVVTGPGFTFLPAGNRLLKGFDQPVEVFSLATA